jgi:hypothetical protein
MVPNELPTGAFASQETAGKSLRRLWASKNCRSCLSFYEQHLVFFSKVMQLRYSASSLKNLGMEAVGGCMQDVQEAQPGEKTPEP